MYNIANLVLNLFLDNYYSWRWQLGHLIIAALVYYMGLVGYKNSELILRNFSTNVRRKVSKTNEEVDLDIIRDLNNIFQKDKIYLNNQLSLQELAQMLSVGEIILSNPINAHYKKNFRSLINELRVKEVENRMLTGGLEILSLLGLARECGFYSEASFYRIFKSVTGFTPKQYFDSYS
jgi:YesN/AraC family two-component response regulator